MGILKRLPPIDTAHPPAADLFRVLAAFCVGWFHIWQQSWVGGGRLDHWPRTGAVWVDVLVLLSAFCLFLPAANARAAGERPAAIRPGAFWRRRAIRILPSYYVCLAFSLVLVVTEHGWYKDLAVDLTAHLTMTQMFFKQSYTLARLNGVTWTLTLYTLLYILFPWLSAAVVRRPVLTLGALLAVQAGYTLWLAPQYGGSGYTFLFNQFPAFCGVLAVGFAGALLFAELGRNPALQKLPARCACTALGAAAFLLVDRLLRLQARSEYQLHQLTHRMPLVLAVCAAMVLLALGLPLPLAGLWKFLAGISYNFYLWHQMLAVWIKYRLRVPAWMGQIPPNQLGDADWMRAYNALAWAVALAAAVVFTYLVEKPAARLFGTKKIPCGRK